MEEDPAQVRAPANKPPSGGFCISSEGEVDRAWQRMIGIKGLRLADLKTPGFFTSPEELIEDIEDHFGGPAFFKWKGQEYVIDGFRTWCFERFSWDTGEWDPVTEEFETADELFDLPFLDGKSLRERFGECEFFVEF